MAREQAQQFLARIPGRAGHGDARHNHLFARASSPTGPTRRAAGCMRLHNCMHRREYLYMAASIKSTKIDE
jgi:hypothetical protein